MSDRERAEEVAEHEPPELSIVLPAHNEVMLLGSTVTNLVTGLAERAHTFELIVAENGSSDGTLHLAELLAIQFEQVRVLHDPKGDYGSALVSGFLAARAPIVVNFDVDYYDLAFLDVAMERLAAGSDLVLASKRAPGARDDRPILRRALTLGLAVLLRAVLGLKVSDTHGMKALRRAQFVSIVSRCTMRESMFDAEMVLRAERAGLSIAEIPARVIERRPPRTSLAHRTLESVVGVAVLWRRLASADAEPHASE